MGPIMADLGIHTYLIIFACTIIFRENLNLDYIKFTGIHFEIHQPFVVWKFVSVVVLGHKVHEEYVLGFWVESRDFHLVTGKHPPTRSTFRKNKYIILQTQTDYIIILEVKIKKIIAILLWEKKRPLRQHSHCTVCPRYIVRTVVLWQSCCLFNHGFIKIINRIYPNKKKLTDMYSS